MSSDRKSSHACKSCQSKKTRCQIPEGEKACYKCLQKGTPCSFGDAIHWSNPPKYRGFPNAPATTSSYGHSSSSSSAPVATMSCGYCAQRRIQCDGAAPCSQCTMGGYACPGYYSASQPQSYASQNGYSQYQSGTPVQQTAYYATGVPQAQYQRTARPGTHLLVYAP
ncbi:hypothetical protein BDV98DRAFT_596912 [Pterulicium gracile]|uniref:Zn(2)-C6 fungal-type domain-containing protein n=1 Tax=Pterulicium gracile TaxID=1884261 RepID=A0A5C3Q9Q7_9AGAR|nr:hypothetical protein BDV98DRAFT_596912 [Pterula gracilis]